MRKRATHADPIASSRLDRGAHCAALASAIRESADPERARLLTELIERVTAPRTWSELALLRIGSVAGTIGARSPETSLQPLVALIQVWDLLDDDMRHVALASGTERLHHAALLATALPDPAARRAAVAALKDLDSQASLAAIVPLLSDTEAVVASAADRALVAMVEGWCTQDDPCRGFKGVGGSIVQAISAPSTDRLRGPATAALVLMSPSRMSRASGLRIDVLADWLEREGGQNHGLRAVVRGSRHPVARLRAWQWLSRSSLWEPCIARLSRCHDLAEHEAVLTSAHLFSNPRRSRFAKQIGRAGGLAADSVRAAGGEIAPAATGSIPPGGPLPKPSDVPALSPRAKWGLTIWTSTIGVPAPVRRAVLEPLLTDPSPGVRLSAARVASSEDLADYCFDEDVAVARTAMMRWSLLGIRRAPRKTERTQAETAVRLRLLSRLARSPHAAVRRIATDDLRLADPIAACDGGSIPPAPAIAAVGDPSRFGPILEHDLTWESPARAARALRIIQKTSMAGQMQEPLARLMSLRPPPTEHGGSSLPERLAATIVSTLADVAPRERTEPCRKVLEDALHDADDRVRANAVDGLARDARRNAISPGSAAVLLELKEDRHHRVRASALRGLLWTDDPAGRSKGSAGDMMIEMLSDGRSSHRLAGVWLCERWVLTGCPSEEELSIATDRLRDLADRDIDERLVARAMRTVRRIRLLSSVAEDLGPLEEVA